VNDPHPLTRREERAIEEASRWFVRARDGLSPQEEAELLNWLRQAPEHAAAMEMVRLAWDASDETVQRRVSGGARRSRGAAARTQPRRRPASGALPAAAAVAASLAVAAAVGWSSLSTRVVYSAPRGEQLALALPDGTRVRLDSGTRLEVRFNPFRRRVKLDEGEAEFVIAKDAWRPFRVDARSVEVWDRGTQFTVRRRGSAVRVVLMQGKVELHEQGTGRLRARLSPGQQALIDEGGQVALAKADLFTALAWREGQLVLNDTSVADALAEFRLRSPVEIALADPALGDLRVSGVFRLNDPVGFLNGLSNLYPVRWREAAPGRYELAGPPR
jgi:transmembrane sensor